MKRKRILAFLLAAAMVIPSVPAYAAGSGTADEQVDAADTGTQTETVSSAEDESVVNVSESADKVSDKEDNTPVEEQIKDDPQEPGALGPEKWSLRGVVFDDKDKDGVQDENEEALEGIRVRLYDPEKYSQGDKTVLAEDETDKDGKYELKELDWQDVRVEFYAPEESVENVLYEGIIPEDMQQRIDSGESDYEIILPSEEEDEWLEAIPVVSPEEDREINTGITYSVMEKEEPKENDETNSTPAEDSEEPGNVSESGAGDPADNKEAADESEPAETDEAKDQTEEDTTLPAGETTIRADEDTAVAEVNKTNGFVTFFSNIFGEDWNYDVYYVGEDDSSNVTLTGNKSLKYQIEFSNAREIGVGQVEIRIPQALLQYRDGTPVLPSEIAVPAGDPEDPTESRITPFNYYVDDTDLVFFNYKTLEAGTNAVFQVLYRNLSVMDIKDGTEWSLESSCTVSADQEEPSVGRAEPLCGTVDTSAKLTAVSMASYVIDGKSYAPGLYTEGQIAKIISGSIPEKYRNNFDDYRYVVWTINIRGTATQPWELYLKAQNEDNHAEIVGFSVSTSQGEDPYGEYIRIGSGDSGSPSNTVLMVTAYPKEYAQAGTKVENQVEVLLHPYDGLDADTAKSASSSWTYSDYEWTYIGDKLGIAKTNLSGESSYPSWLNVYKAARNAGEDKGGFRFRVSSTARGYDKTHVTENGDQLGDPIEGKSYQTVTADDFVYAYLNTSDISSSPDKYRILDGEDYYFSSVKVTQTDRGYDPYEDDYASPEKPDVEGQEKGLVIYAMFAESDTPDEWEWVATQNWGSTMSYQFTDDQIARKPWRVKAVHRTTNYSTECQIDVTMMIRHDSPQLEEFINSVGYEENVKVMSLENLGAVIGQIYDKDQPTGSYMGTGASGGYREPELEGKSEELYDGVLPVRANSMLSFTSLQENAGAYKSGSSWNDVRNGRVNLRFDLTAYDGYLLYGSEAISYLKSERVDLPGKKEVTFYDILPYGVRFDPSVEVTAGRLKSTVPIGPQSWDPSQVSVTVDPETDVIQDYNGSGRTMIRFHITYTGADPSVYSDQMWMEGYGVSFGAYYDWKDMDVANGSVNIAAFMSDDDKPILGGEGRVEKDNGEYSESLENSGAYEIFGPDIDQDGSQEDPVLYAQTGVYGDGVQAATKGIRKLVRADSDRFGVYKEATEADPGEGYSYDITVTNTSGVMSDIVIFDHLDQGSVDRPDGVYEDSWQGTFQKVVTTSLEKSGAAPVIWYSADPDAKTAEDNMDLDELLTSGNGWYTAEEWARDGKTADQVRSVAVDIRKDSKGGSFTLKNIESVSFQIQMKSPEEETGSKAYNAAGYHYTVAGEQSKWEMSDVTEVSRHIPGQFEIVKEFTGEIPDAVQDSQFLFKVYSELSGEKELFADREYELYQLTDGEWVRQGADRVYATDGSGTLELKAGQKAVFHTPEARLLSAEEEENPFWDTTYETEWPDGDTKIQTATNRYRPVLYLKKETEAVPDDANVSDDEFTFRLEADGKAVTDAEFWYVDSVRTDGGIPAKNTALGKKGVGHTDENGELTIHTGEIVALFPGNEDCEYKITETEGYGDGTDWLCIEDSAEGTLPYNGTSVEITNFYKWKDLYIAKKLTHQDPAVCEQSFTFQLTDEEGQPVQGKTWVMLEADGQDSDTRGETDEHGMFSAPCAGKIIRVEDLEGGRTYLVTEIDEKGYEDGDLYEPVEGTAEVEMPVYGLNSRAIITNDYILRPLSVTKTVNYDPETIKEDDLAAISKAEFTMTASVDGKLLAEEDYIVQEGGTQVSEGTTTAKGEFTIKNGQTVVFPEQAPKGSTFSVQETQDPEYPQIFPSENKPAEGTFGENGAETQIINGYGGTLLVGKEYTKAENAGPAVEEYIEKLQGDLRADGQVSLSLQIKADADSSYVVWPEQDTEVTVIDQLTNKMRDATWNRKSEFTVQPWEYVVITGLDSAAEYRLSERAEDQHDIISYTDDEYDTHKFEISQKIPADDQSLTGTVAQNPRAVIYNQVAELTAVSKIVKEMLSADNPVVEGAQLAYRIERFDGEVWSPAEGIPYIVTSGDEIVSDRTEKTGEDGMILLYKSGEETPTVEFTEDKVTVHPKDPAIGSLRAVEVAESTDPSWGRFAGYVSADRSESGITVWDGTGFANSNTMHTFEVAKEMKTPADETFTMILEQITAATESPVTSKDQILETVPGSGISYVIYDTATGSQAGTAVTGPNGEIYLKAGQYASISVEAGTEWTVSEKIPGGYTLDGLSGENSDGPTTAVKADDNLMIVGTEKPEVVLPEITLTKEMVQKGVINGETKEHVTLNEGDVVIPETIIDEDGVKKRVTAIGDSAFDQSGVSYSPTITDEGVIKIVSDSKITGISMPDSIEVIGDNAFCMCMNINTMEISENVKEIGNLAFQMVGMARTNSVNKMNEDGYYTVVYPLDKGAETFTVPESVEKLGYGAFMGSTVGVANLDNCRIIELAEYPYTQLYSTFMSCLYLKECTLSSSLTQIPIDMFGNCWSLETVNIPDGVEEIGEQAFTQSAIKEIVFPESIKLISDSAFGGCINLTKITLIGKSENEIEGAPWGAPDGVEIVWENGQ